MANVDRPFGARVVQAGVAAGYNARATVYRANNDRSSTNNHGDIYPGDFVTLSGGYVVPAVTGDAILGVVVAVGPSDGTNFGREGFFDPDSLGKRYLAYDEEGRVLVVDDPNVLVEIQEVADDLVLTDIGSTFDIDLAAGEAHGNRETGESTVEMDGSASVNNDLRVVDLVDRVDNEVGTNAKWLVKINNHYYNQ